MPLTRCPPSKPATKAPNLGVVGVVELLAHVPIGAELTEDLLGLGHRPAHALAARGQNEVRPEGPQLGAFTGGMNK